MPHQATQAAPGQEQRPRYLPGPLPIPESTNYVDPQVISQRLALAKLLRGGGQSGGGGGNGTWQSSLAQMIKAGVGAYGQYQAGQSQEKALSDQASNTKLRGNEMSALIRGLTDRRNNPEGNIVTDNVRPTSLPGPIVEDSSPLPGTATVQYDGIRRTVGRRATPESQMQRYDATPGTPQVGYSDSNLQVPTKGAIPPRPEDFSQDMLGLPPRGLGGLPDQSVSTLQPHEWQDFQHPDVQKQVLNYEAGNLERANKFADDVRARESAFDDKLRFHNATRPAPKQTELQRDLSKFKFLQANGYKGSVLDFLGHGEEPEVAPDKTANFGNEKNLRGEFVSQAKDFVKVRDAYIRIIKSSKDPSLAGDLALIFNYMKVLDPGSTVREGEFATAQNSGSVPNTVWAKYNQIVSGERLTPVLRDDFVNRAGMLYSGQKDSHIRSRGEYTKLSESYGLDPSRVVIDYFDQESPLGAVTSESGVPQGPINPAPQSSPNRAAEDVLRKYSR